MKLSAILLFLTAAAYLDKRQIVVSPSAAAPVMPATAAVPPVAAPTVESPAASSAAPSATPVASAVPVSTNVIQTAAKPTPPSAAATAAASSSAVPVSTVIIICVIVGVIFAASLMIYVIRKTSLKPSSDFKSRMDPGHNPLKNETYNHQQHHGATGYKLDFSGAQSLKYDGHPADDIYGSSDHHSVGSNVPSNDAFLTSQQHQQNSYTSCHQNQQGRGGY